MKLSETYDLKDFLKSYTADKEGFSEQYSPPDDVVKNLKKLVDNIIQPLSDKLLHGKIKITSGYRCRRLNDHVGGKPTSQHMNGMAADIQFYFGSVMINIDIIDAVKDLNLEYDQMIWENGGKWVHISFNEGHNRNQHFNLNQKV